ncbi:unnamed protein product, partial [Hapterophycus canaliculatus]
ETRHSCFFFFGACSLRHHLDDPALKARLGWRLRVRTTLHMCNGLEYLH